MNARDAILQRIRQRRPPPIGLPEMEIPALPAADLTEVFTEAVAAAGGRVFACAGGALGAALAARYPAPAVITSCLPDTNLPGVRQFEPDSEPPVSDVLLCEGVFGVAENGSVWLSESCMGHRAAPFLAEHLALALDASEMVATMHEAYARLSIEAEGFGVFIAGPSKTADIEQSLVIGAHGPRSLTVLLRG